jgi:hypothetical protein
MSAQGNLNQGQRIAIVTNNASLLDEGRISDLAPEQLGIFQKSTIGKCDPFLATSAPEFRKDLKFKIAQGVKNRLNLASMNAGIPNFYKESIEFSAKSIVGWQGIPAQHSTKEDKVAIGFDGVDITKNMISKLGQRVVFYVHLTGGVINMLTGHTRGLSREYIIDPACIADCADPCGNEACQRLQNEVIKQIENDKWNRIPITALIKATKITSCTPPAPALTGLVEYTYWCVSQCDEGSQTSLGLVQAQQKGKKVERIERKGSISTYRFIQKTSDAAPADLTNEGLLAIPNCKTCPTGYNYKGEMNVYEVKVPCGGTLTPLTGQVSAVKLSSDLEFDVYQVFTDLSAAPADVIAAAEGKTVTTVTSTTNAIGTSIVDTEQNGSANKNGVPINHEALRDNIEITSESVYKTVTGIGTKCVSALFTGTASDVCILATASTTAWDKCGTCNKAPKKYQITLADNVCGGDRLAELQAAYPELIISIKATGVCVHSYETTIMSNCFNEPCSVESLHWVRPTQFDGISWEEVVTPVAPSTAACSCGIILEGLRYRQSVTECTLPYFGYDMRFDDPVHIHVSTHNHDYTSSICDSTDIPFTVLQTADYDLGQGRAVMSAEEESMSYFLANYSTNPVIRDLFGYNYVTKAETYYDEYQLTLAPSHGDAHYFNGGADSRVYIYRFFFPEGQGKAFEHAINTLVTSGGLDSLALVTL